MDITEKIDNYISNDDVYSLLEFAALVETYDSEVIEEAVTVERAIEGIRKILPKMGIDIQKKGKGLIGIFKESRKEMKEFFWNLFKAARGDEEAKKRVRDMSKGKVSKGDVFNVLLKMDVLILHMLSVPLHVLEYLTGWKVTGLKKGEENELKSRFQNALQSLRDLSNKLFGKEKKRINNYISTLEKLKKRKVEV